MLWKRILHAVSGEFALAECASEESTMIAYRFKLDQLDVLEICLVYPHGSSAYAKYRKNRVNLVTNSAS